MIYYGFDEVVYGWERYFDLCNSFELRPPANPDDSPNIATLNKWRVDSPKGFAWQVHVEPEVLAGLFDAYENNTSELPETLDEALIRTEERASAIAAKVVMLETPPNLPPSDTSRELIRALGKRWAEISKRPLIWESSGLWTLEDGLAVAKDAGLPYVVDPFMLHNDDTALPRGPIAAFRVTERAAARRQFDAWEMELLLEWASGYERAFILLAGRYKIPHAKELSLLINRDS